MLTRQLPIAIYFFIFPFISFSQSYYINITNGSLAGKNKYEFDIVITSISGNLELTSYQVSLKYNINSEQLNFSYINGTSQLNNIPAVGIGIFRNNNDSVLAFASLPGVDTIAENEIKIGRFAITSIDSLSD